MGKMRFGIHRALEDEANRILAESLKGVTSHSAKSDILTPWKERERRRREVYVTDGTPDAAIRRGMFKKVANKTHPHLNSRDGVAPAIAMEHRPSRTSTWAIENGWSGSPDEDYD